MAEAEQLNIYDTQMIEVVNNIIPLCQSFHIYCKIIPYKMGTIDSRAGHYVVLGIEPIPENVNPIEIIERDNRRKDVFYPKNCAVQVNKEHMMTLLNKVTDYCRKAEFLKYICHEYKVKMPQFIKKIELNTLMSLNYDATNPTYDSYAREVHQQKIDDYVELNMEEDDGKDVLEKEKSTGIFGLFKKDKKKNQNVSMEKLFEGSNLVRKICISEFQYEDFQEEIKKFPDVLYHEGEKKVYDHGMVDGPWGKAITDREFNEILEKRFATMQYKVLDGIAPSYFEDRILYFKESDLQIVASIVNKIEFKYSQCNPLWEMRNLGDGMLSVFDISTTDTMNFISLAKAQKLPFCLDYEGKMSTPNFETIGVIVTTYDAPRVKRILSKLAKGKFRQESHALTPEQMNKIGHTPIMKLDEQIQNAQRKAVINTKKNTDQRHIDTFTER